MSVKHLVNSIRFPSVLRVSILTSVLVSLTAFQNCSPAQFTKLELAEVIPGAPPATNNVFTPLGFQSKVIVGGDNKLDILLVVDDSGSMGFEYQSIKQRLSSMFQQLEGLSWRLAITTTDVTTPLISGLLKKFKGPGIDGYYIDSTMNPTDRKLAFDATLDMLTGGSGSEQGVMAAVNSIRRLSEGLAVESKQKYLKEQTTAVIVKIQDGLTAFTNNLATMRQSAGNSRHLNNPNIKTSISSLLSAVVASNESKERDMEDNIRGLMGKVDQAQSFFNNCVSDRTYLESATVSRLISPINAKITQVQQALEVPVITLAEFQAQILQVQALLAELKTLLASFRSVTRTSYDRAAYHCPSIGSQMGSISNTLNMLRAKQSPLSLTTAVNNAITPIWTQFGASFANQNIMGQSGMMTVSRISSVLFNNQGTSLSATMGAAATDLKNKLDQGFSSAENVQTPWLQTAGWDPASDPSLQFFRQDAAFSIIVVSDADENLSNVSAHVPLVQRGQYLLDGVKNTLGNTKGFVFNAITVPYPDVGNCGGRPNRNENPGQLYTQIANMTGGILGDVCKTDWAGQLSRIGARTAELAQKNFILNCVPKDIDGDPSTVDVTVKDNGVEIFDGFRIEKDQIILDFPVPVGHTLEILYQCPPVADPAPNNVAPPGQSNPIIKDPKGAIGIGTTRG